MVRSEKKGALSPFEEMEQLFEDFFCRPAPPLCLQRPRFLERGEVVPAVDIFEEENEVVVKAEIPGVSKGNLAVNIAGEAIPIPDEKNPRKR